MAIGIWTHTGKTDWGYMRKIRAMTIPKIATTIHKEKRITKRKSIFTRELIILLDNSPIDTPLFLVDIIRAA
jgi:hypothetical protein